MAKPVGAYDVTGNIIIRFPEPYGNRFVTRKLHHAWVGMENIKASNDFVINDEKLYQRFRNSKYYVTRTGKFRARDTSGCLSGFAETTLEERSRYFYYGKNSIVPYSMKVIL